MVRGRRRGINGSWGGGITTIQEHMLVDMFGDSLLDKMRL